MVSTPDRFTDYSPMSPGPSVTVKNPNSRKLLHLFTKLSDTKNKYYVRQVGASKSKRKAIISFSMLYSSIPKSRRHTKIN